MIPVEKILAFLELPSALSHWFGIRRAAISATMAPGALASVRTSTSGVSCHLRIQHCAESGKDGSKTHGAIDVFAEGLATHFDRSFQAK